MTLMELLADLRAISGYIHDRKRADEHGGLVKCYTFWMQRDSDFPNDFKNYEVRILVLNEGEPEEEAKEYSRRHILPISHAFRDALLAKISEFTGSHPEYEKFVIDSLNEDWEIALGRAYKKINAASQEINWVGFIKEGGTEVKLRILD